MNNPKATTADKVLSGIGAGLDTVALIVPFVPAVFGRAAKGIKTGVKIVQKIHKVTRKINRSGKVHRNLKRLKTAHEVADEGNKLWNAAKEGPDQLLKKIVGLGARKGAGKYFSAKRQKLESDFVSKAKEYGGKKGARAAKKFVGGREGEVPVGEMVEKIANKSVGKIEAALTDKIEPTPQSSSQPTLKPAPHGQAP